MRDGMTVTQAKNKDSEEGKGKQGANIDTEISLPHRASDMDELDIVIKLHRVERHIRKNKLKVLCRTVINHRQIAADLHPAFNHMSAGEGTKSVARMCRPGFDCTARLASAAANDDCRCAAAAL